MYEKKREETGYHYFYHAKPCFDGVWSLAFALNATLNGHEVESCTKWLVFVKVVITSISIAAQI